MQNVRRILGLLAVVTTLVIGTAPAALVQEASRSSTAPYAIVELGSLGGTSSRAFGINDMGWVAGHVYDAEERQRAVLWKDGDAIDLGTLGGDEAGALDVNDRGQVVGNSTTQPGTIQDDPSSHAFLWQAGRMRDLGTLGGDMSVAQDINEHGQVVGASTTAPGQLLSFFDDGPRAFLWENGQMTDLGTFGGERSWAMAINDEGQIVGTAQTATGEDHAFLWEDGHMTDLGSLGGQAVALAINRHGQVVGGSTTRSGQEFTETGTRALRWDDGVMASLGGPDGPDGTPYGVNDRGGAVGNLAGVGAVVWRAEEAVTLADFLPPDSGWEILALARAINEQGQIVGWGQRNGATRAFIASPAGLVAMTGTSGPSATPSAEIVGLEAAEVVARSQRAIREAGTYRYEVFGINAVEEPPFRVGEVEIGRGHKTSEADGTNLEYFDGQTLYTLRPDGEWLARVPPTDRHDSLVDFLGVSPAGWSLAGMESVNGRSVYVIESTTQETETFTVTQTLWIDASTFLPHKWTSVTELDGFEPFGNETIYSDFGDAVDVSPPAAALAPTPTPEPLPETSGGRITIALRDIYFEPTAVTIPANEDVLIVLPNEGAAVHNFTIDEFGISSGNIEWGMTEHVIVNLPPGVYEFRCTIPGHTEAGQVGTLTVRE